jgi:hypothetical protein
MKAVFDTSSLVALIKYYLPFDYNATLLGQIEEHLVTGEMIIIDEVLNECKGTAQGIVISKLSFLGEPTFLKKHKIVKQTDSLLPPSQKKFSNMLNNQFVNTTMRKSISDAEFEVTKNEFLQTADARMIIYLLNEKNKDQFSKFTLITEETKSNNDNKYFNKLPILCAHLDIQCMNLPTYITEKGTLKIDINPINLN